MPGIDKTENGYAKVQRQVLKLRRQAAALSIHRGRDPVDAQADLLRQP